MLLSVFLSIRYQAVICLDARFLKIFTNEFYWSGYVCSANEVLDFQGLRRVEPSMEHDKGEKMM